MTGRVEIRRLAPADVGRVAGRGDAALAAWRYDGAAGGVAIGAFADGEPIGILGGLPRRVRVDGEALDVAELVDVRLDDSPRGAVLFRALHDELLAALRRLRVAAVLCLPAPAADPILRERFEYVPALTIEASTHRVPPEPPRPAPGVDPVLEESSPAGGADPFGPEFDRLDADLAADATATVADAAHLRRRYARHPTPYAVISLRAGRRLEGWVVVAAAEREGRPPEGFLVDARLWPDENVRRSAEAAALRWFRAHGCGSVRAWRADHPHDPPILVAPRAPDAVERRPYLVRPLSPAGRRLLRARTRSRWAFRMGDTGAI